MKTEGAVHGICRIEGQRIDQPAIRPSSFHLAPALLIKSTPLRSNGISPLPVPVSKPLPPTPPPPSHPPPPPPSLIVFNVVSVDLKQH